MTLVAPVRAAECRVRVQRHDVAVDSRDLDARRSHAFGAFTQKLEQPDRIERQVELGEGDGQLCWRFPDSRGAGQIHEAVPLERRQCERVRCAWVGRGVVDEPDDGLSDMWHLRVSAARGSGRAA